MTLEKMKVVDLKKLIKSYKQKSCPAMTGLKKAQLIKLIKDLKITIPVITPISVQVNRMGNTTTPTPAVTKKVVTKKVAPKKVAPKGNTTTPSKSLNDVKAEFNQVKKNLVAKVSENKSILKKYKEVKKYNRVLEVDINNYKDIDTINKMIKNVRELDKVITKIILKSIVK